VRAHYGSTLVLALIVVATGCSKKKLQLLLANDDDLPSASPSVAAAPPSVAPPPTTATSVPTTTATATTTAAAAGYPATCAGVCEKTLRCMSAYSAQEQKSCVDSCQAGRPDPAKFARMVKMDCKALLGAVNGGGGGGGGASPSGPCNDCNTCVWDGTSCYSRVPPFLACDACCCRKGGPAPRWD